MLKTVERERREKKKEAYRLRLDKIYKTKTVINTVQQAEISKKIKTLKTVIEAKPALKYNKTSQSA